MAQQSAKKNVPFVPMTQPQTTKTLSARIPLDYYKKRSDISRIKILLAFVCILIGVGYVVIGEMFPNAGSARLGPLDLSGSGRVNHGPLHAKHAGFENQCNKCHEPFTAIGSGRAMPGVSDWGVKDWSISDNKCRECHIGPDHHPYKAGIACADCHRDHQGRASNLATQSGKQCAECHQNLEMYGKDLTDIDKKVSHFDFDLDSETHGHPQFRSLKNAHPSNLKFNHVKHAKAGIGIGFKLEQVNDRYRDKYQKASNGEVQGLSDCKLCHVLDSQDRALTRKEKLQGPLPGTPSSGEYFLAPRYDVDCAGCHSLSVGIKGEQKLIEVPHHQQPDEVYEYLENQYALMSLKQQGPSTTRMPGGSVLETPESDPVAKHRKQIDDSMAILFKAVRRVGDDNTSSTLAGQTCIECHRFQDSTGASIDDANVLGKVVEKRSDVRVKPTVVPIRWLKHARFNHMPHRAVQCASCHQMPKESDYKGGTDDPGVMIPDIDNCVQCHRDYQNDSLFARMGNFGGGPSELFVRNDCLECHVYHNGANPAQGLGAKSRSSRNQMTISEFLTGKTAEKSAPPSSAKPEEPKAP